LKAIIRTKYGSPDVLELREIDKPAPTNNQVLVRVQAAAVNPLDWHILRGEPFLVRLMGFGLLKPKHQILGADIAGRVEAVGKNVIQFNHGLLQSGQQVLINGASGGVGTFAVQIAKALGAHVTGVCTGGNVEMVGSIGADNVTDYTKAHCWRNGKEYVLIVDNAAFYSVHKPLRALNPTGIYVGVGGSSSTASILKSLMLNPLISIVKGRKVVSFMANVNQSDLALLKGHLEAGKLVTVIDRQYSLSETPQAIRYVEEGHSRGKVIITIL